MNCYIILFHTFVLGVYPAVIFCILQYKNAIIMPADSVAASKLQGIGFDPRIHPEYHAAVYTVHDCI